MKGLPQTVANLRADTVAVRSVLQILGYTKTLEAFERVAAAHTRAGTWAGIEESFARFDTVLRSLIGDDPKSPLYCLWAARFDAARDLKDRFLGVLPREGRRTLGPGNLRKAG